MAAGARALAACLPPQVMTGDEESDEFASVQREAACQVVWETLKYLRGYATGGKGQ